MANTGSAAGNGSEITGRCICQMDSSHGKKEKKGKNGTKTERNIRNGSWKKNKTERSKSTKTERNVRNGIPKKNKTEQSKDKHFLTFTTWPEQQEEQEQEQEEEEQHKRI